MRNYVTQFMAAAVKLSLALSLAVVASTAPARAEGGLAERRAVKEFQDKKYGDLEKQIHAAAGFDVKVSVNWDKLAVPGESAGYMDDSYFVNTIFLPLITSLKDITKDDMGKNALKGALKEITITYDESTAPASNYKNGVTFENGVLAINFRPGSNSDGPGGSNFKDRTDAIREAMEPKL